MLGQLCACTWSAIGVVNRCGQEKSTICDAHGPCQRNRSILKPVFCRFRLMHRAYMLLRCLDLEIWRFSCRRRRQWQTYKLITLPVAHVRGVTIWLFFCDFKFLLIDSSSFVCCCWIYRPSNKILLLSITSHGQLENKESGNRNGNRNELENGHHEQIHNNTRMDMVLYLDCSESMIVRQLLKILLQAVFMGCLLCTTIHESNTYHACYQISLCFYLIGSAMH